MSVISFSVMILLFFKQKTAYEMRISDWSSDVCSSDLGAGVPAAAAVGGGLRHVDRARLLDVAARAGRTGAGGRPVPGVGGDRKSVVLGKSVSVRVDLGCRRIIKKKKHHAYVSNNDITTKNIRTHSRQLKSHYTI